jgi:CRP/FNR family transcriptional regulator
MPALPASGRWFDSDPVVAYTPGTSISMEEPRKKTFHKDALIYIESDEDSDDVFILEKGEVELKGTPGMPMYRSLLGPGDIFGFISGLARRPRMESAVARTDCVCAVLGRERFIESAQSNPDLAGRIISYFARELRAYDDLVAARSAEAAPADEEDQLFAVAGHLAAAGGARQEHTRHALEVCLRRFPRGRHAADAAKLLRTLAATPAAAPMQRGPFRVYPDARMIFCEHEPGNELFIIKSGKVEIVKISPPEEVLLSILREGDIFGELSLVSSAPRSATAISVGETLLLPVSRASLPSVFQKSPATVGRILSALSQRLWFTFIRLRARAYENPATRTYVLLENKLLEERISLSGTRPCELPLGIGEILGMAGVAPDQMEMVKNLLAGDENLTFQFRQVTIESPSALEAMARYFRARDRLEIPAPAAARKRRAGPPRSIGLEPRDMRVPPENIPEE